MTIMMTAVMMVMTSPVPVFVITAADLITGGRVLCGLVKTAQGRLHTLHGEYEEVQECK